MDEYKIIDGLSHYIIVEPIQKSTVFQAEEIATIFKVISFGQICQVEISPGDLIIVAANSVEKCMMNNQWIYYIRDTDAIARISIKE